MKLPNRDLAVVDLSKLIDYCLNPEHEEGKHKARVFKAIGVGQEDATWLREKLLAAAASQEAIQIAETRFGTLYVLDFGLKKDRQGAMIRSGWIVRHGEDFPPADHLFGEGSAIYMTSIPLLAAVALTEDVPDAKLTRGQIGTVVELLQSGEESAVLVEFADEDGRMYAMLPLLPHQVLVLHRDNKPHLRASEYS